MVSLQTEQWVLYLCQMINKFVSRFLMFFKQCCFLYGSRSKIQCNTHKPNARFNALQRKERTQSKLVNRIFTNQVLWISVHIRGIFFFQRTDQVPFLAQRAGNAHCIITSGPGIMKGTFVYLHLLAKQRSASWILDMRPRHCNSRPWTQNTFNHATNIYVGNTLKY